MDKKKNEIDMLDTFVFTSDKVHADLYSVIVDLDLIIRRHSGPPHEKSIEHLMSNKEAFEKDALRLIWSIVHANLDVDTIADGSPQEGQKGLFPTRAGEPCITHLMWQLKHYEKRGEDYVWLQSRNRSELEEIKEQVDFVIEKGYHK